MYSAANLRLWRAIDQSSHFNPSSSVKFKFWAPSECAFWAPPPHVLAIAPHF